MKSNLPTYDFGRRAKSSTPGEAAAQPSTSSKIAFATHEVFFG